MRNKGQLEEMAKRKISERDKEHILGERRKCQTNRKTEHEDANAQCCDFRDQ